MFFKNDQKRIYLDFKIYLKGSKSCSHIHIFKIQCLHGLHYLYFVTNHVLNSKSHSRVC